MLTIALAVPDFSRTTLNLPKNLNSAKNTSPWAILALMDSSRKGKECCFGQSSSQGKDELNPLIRSPRADAIEGAPSEFGEFVAREAQLDEEYCAAAWLRAECHWEGRQHERNAENCKWMFAEKEFFSLKKRCDVQQEKKCKCILMVKKEGEVEAKNTMVKRVVGSLDLQVQYFSPGQTFPDERIVAPPFGPIDRSASNSYGYILNLCVAKSARRQGLATRMLQHAISTAKEQGIKKVFLRVYGHNEAAVGLYEKVGFKIVEAANCDNCSDLPSLLCFQT